MTIIQSIANSLHLNSLDVNTPIVNSPLVNALGWTLVHSLWQGFGVAAVLGLVLWSMRSRSAAARCAVGMAAMMLLVVCAALTFVVLNRQAVERPMRTGPIDFVEAQETELPMQIDPGTRLPTQDRPRSLAIALRPMLPWLVVTWAAGVAILGAYQLCGWALVRRIKRSGESVTDRAALAAFDQMIQRLTISRPVRLTRSMLVQVPTVIGWLRPVVLLPMNALTGLTSDQLRGLLAHELAHVRRNDYLVNVVQTVVETLLFYHPAVWWMGRVIRQERENACDDLAAEVCDRATYATALATMERLRQTRTLALSARGGILLARIRRLISPGSKSSTPKWSWTSAAILIAIVAVPVVALQLRAHAADQKPGQKQDSATQPTTAAVSETQFSPLTPEDLQAGTDEYRIGKNDLIGIAVMDLEGAGKETTKSVRVSEKGVVRFPYVGEIKAVGQTEAELEKSIAKALVDGAIIHAPQVSVAIQEARANTFSILGAVGQPGQYAISSNDFRVLDALVLARDTTGDVKTLRIIRPEPGKPKSQSRQIEIPLEPLRNGDLNYNIVIRPNDLLLARPPQPNGEYYISGVNRTGVYSFGERRITLRQALAAAGYDAPAGTKSMILRRRDNEAGTESRQTLALTKEFFDGPDGKMLVEPNDVLMVTDLHVEAGEYYISGHVPRTGAYSLTGRSVNLIQALIAAGANPPEMKRYDIRVVRRNQNNTEMNSRFTVAELLEKTDFVLKANDVIEVSKPKDDLMGNSRHETSDATATKPTTQQ